MYLRVALETEPEVPSKVLYRSAISIRWSWRLNIPLLKYRQFIKQAITQLQLFRVIKIAVVPKNLIYIHVLESKSIMQKREETANSLGKLLGPLFPGYN